MFYMHGWHEECDVLTQNHISVHQSHIFGGNGSKKVSLTHFSFSFLVLFSLSLHSANRTMSIRSTGGGVNDVTRFLSTGGGLGSPTSNPTPFSAASQADWAAKRLVWVPSEKHGFEVSWQRVEVWFLMWASPWSISTLRSFLLMFFDPPSDLKWLKCAGCCENNNKTKQKKN